MKYFQMGVNLGCHAIKTTLKSQNRTWEKFGSSSMMPGLFGICRSSVPTGGVYSAGTAVGGRGGVAGQDCGAEGWALLVLSSRLVHDRSTCSLSSAGSASRTERSTLDNVKKHLKLQSCILSVQPVHEILTCEGEGTSMLRLSCSRVCFGVCLHACRSLLVPGTGSGEDWRRDSWAMVEEVISWCESAASVTKINGQTYTPDS